MSAEGDVLEYCEQREREREKEGGREGGFNQVARRGEEGFLFVIVIV